MKRLLLALCAMVALASAYEVNFPAISDNAGTIVMSNINCEPGKGDGISLMLPPSFDQNAINSMINAYTLASERAGETCRSTISFGQDEVKIEGPSGGLQFYLFYYSVLSGKSFPNDLIASGEIDENGNIYPVGGEYEKARAAKDSSYKYFLVNPATIYDYYALSKLNGSGFNVIFVNTLGDARTFIDTGNAPKFDIGYLVETPKEINETCPYNASWLAKYYAWMIDDFDAQMAETRMPDGLKEKYAESFNKSVALSEMGYHYTAANYLFLNLENIRAFNRIAEKRPIDRAEADECIDRFNAFTPTYGTYELYAGASSRFERANELAFDTESNISSTQFENAYALEQALLWCTLAETLYNDSESGNSLNTEVLKSALQPALYNVSYYGDDVERARRLFIAGEYLASYYELSYFMSSEKMKPELKPDYTSKWGNAFAGQAYYLNRTGQPSAGSASLANYIDDMGHYVMATGQGTLELSPESGKTEAQLAQETRESGFKILTVLIAVALVMALAYVIAKPRSQSHGNKRKSR